MSQGTQTYRNINKTTHPTQGNGSSSQSDQTTISRVGLMYSICIVVTELVYNLGYSVMVVCSKSISNDGLKSGKASGQRSVEEDSFVESVRLGEEGDDGL